MNDTTNSEFKKWYRPRIVLSDEMISISDPPFAWRIFLTILCAAFTIFYVVIRNVYNDPYLILIFLCGSLLFLYDSLSLKRVKIDLEKKVIFHSSLNPVENLINILFRRPSEIPFTNVKKIYADYNEVVAPATTRYFVFVQTVDQFKIKIGTFQKEAYAIEFAEYLSRMIKKMPRSIGI
jgi:hypothetical protein